MWINRLPWAKVHTVMTHQCAKCGESLPICDFPPRHDVAKGFRNYCYKCVRREKSDLYRRNSQNWKNSVKRYRKTFNSFVMREFEYMTKKGVETVQRHKFYAFCLENKALTKMYSRYILSGRDKRLKPRLTRKRLDRGFIEGNLEFRIRGKHEKIPYTVLQ